MIRYFHREDCTFIKSTYKDNPFLPDELVKEIERLRDTDEDYWKIYGLGERGFSKSIIFPRVEIMSKIPEEAKLISTGLRLWIYKRPKCFSRGLRITRQTNI